MLPGMRAVPGRAEQVRQQAGAQSSARPHTHHWVQHGTAACTS